MKTLRPRVGRLDTRSAAPAAKQADAELGTADHRAFRTVVLKRAGWRCEVVVDGVRCANRHPQHRLYADHVIERQDGGALFDPANGLCKCASHHTLKTNEERLKRHHSPVEAAKPPAPSITPRG